MISFVLGRHYFVGMMSCGVTHTVYDWWHMLGHNTGRQYLTIDDLYSDHACATNHAQSWSTHRTPFLQNNYTTYKVINNYKSNRKTTKVKPIDNITTQ